MTPDATWQQWTDDPGAAFQAVAAHAANVGNWGAIEWLVTIAGALATFVKIAKFLPLPPFVNTAVQMADSWLPRLTGRGEKKVREQANKNLEVAKAAVAGVDDALELLRMADPDLADKAVERLKLYQDRLGIREEVRDVIKAVRQVDADG